MREEEEVLVRMRIADVSRAAGLTIAISVANSLFLNEAERGIRVVLPQLSKAQIQASIAGLGSHFVKTLPENTQEKVLDAIVDGLNKTYVLVIVGGGVAIVGSLFLKRERLFVKQSFAA